MNKGTIIGFLIIFSGTSEAQGIQNIGEIRERKAHSLLARTDLLNQPTPVTLDKELDQLFGSSGCQLPPSLIRILRKRNKAGFLPEDLRSILGTDISQPVQKIAATNVRAVLLTATFWLQDGSEKNIRLTGPSVTTKLDPLKMMDQNVDNFAYSMDCSSYLNAAIAIEGGVSAAEGKAAANAAVRTDKSFVVVRANLYSPISLAMNPDVFHLELNRVDRLDILFSLVREVLAADSAAGDDTKIGAARNLPVLWTSNEGSSALGGKASFNASTGVGAGIVAIKGNGSSGTSFAREISYSKFNTYVFDSTLSDPMTSSLKNLRSTVISLVNSTANSPAIRSGNMYSTTYDLPRNICIREWHIQSSSTGNAVSGSVKPTWTEEQGCSLTLTPSEAPSATELRFWVSAPTELGHETTFRLSFPLL